MLTKRLNNGVEMPVAGYGVYQISDMKLCQRCVCDAIQAGYRLIDTAAIYGNEKAVGDAIKECGVPREELFITSKLWPQDAGYEKAKKAIDVTLERLQLDYLDLYLIHEPMGDLYGSWRAMEEMVQKEKLRAIGVSNMWPDRLMDLIVNNKIIPAVNQIETHPFCQQQNAHEFLEAAHIQHEAWAPFAEGREGIFQNKTLAEIGNKHCKSVAQIILRWLIQRDIVVLSKTVNKQRMQENLQVFDFELSEEEMQSIAILDRAKPMILNNRDPEVVKRICSVHFEH